MKSINVGTVTLARLLKEAEQFSTEHNIPLCNLRIEFCGDLNCRATIAEWDWVEGRPLKIASA